MRKILALVLVCAMAASSAYGLELMRQKIAVDGNQQELLKWAQDGFMIKPGPSNGVWQTHPDLSYADPMSAFSFFEDFVAYPAVDQSPYKLVGWYSTSDSSGVNDVVPVADATGGAVKYSIPKHAANSGTIMSLADRSVASSEPFKITRNSRKKVWFGIRFSFASGQNDSVTFGIGLARKTATWDTLLADTTGALNGTFLGLKTGMLTPGTSPDTLKLSYKLDGGDAVERPIGVITAGVWHLAGFYFDGLTTITPYFDGVAKTPITVPASAFPTENMTLVMVGKKLGLINRGINIDWIKVTQLR